MQNRKQVVSERCVGVVCVYVPVAKFEGQLRKFISVACDSKCAARRLLHHLPPVVEALQGRPRLRGRSNVTVLGSTYAGLTLWIVTLVGPLLVSMVTVCLVRRTTL